MNLRNKKFATVAEYDNYIEGNYPKPNVSYIVEGGVMKYQKDAPAPLEERHLTFTALESGTFQLSTNAVDYSLDGGATWTTLAAGTASPTVTAGSKIMWKGELIPNSTNGIGTFSSTGTYNVEGNPMSLLFGDNFIGQTSLSGKNYAFFKLFNGSKIVEASKLVLPATTLSDRCYYIMFQSSKKLTTSPTILPATALTSDCYNSMFRSCDVLVTTPELPALTLVTNCYNGMFYNSHKVNYIKMLATNISAGNCLLNWTFGVSGTGTFVKNASMSNLPTGTSGIPSGWTVIEV